MFFTFAKSSPKKIFFQKKSQKENLILLKKFIAFFETSTEAAFKILWFLKINIDLFASSLK